MKHLKEYKLFENRLNRNEITELLDYLDDIFYDLVEDGYDFDYGGTLLNITICRKSKERVAGFNKIMKFNLSEIAGTIKMMHNYITSTGLQLKHIEIERRWGAKREEIKFEDIDNIGEITMLKMKYPEIEE